MAAPRFFFITNDVPRAALEISCHPGNVPSWIAVLDSFDDWMRIPSGSKCMAFWYGSAGDLEGWRNAWAVRKERGDIIGIEPWELDKILAWAEEHRERANLKRLYGIEPDKDAAEQSAATSLITTEEPIVPPAAMIDQTVKTVKRGQKWT